MAASLTTFALAGTTLLAGPALATPAKGTSTATSSPTSRSTGETTRSQPFTPTNNDPLTWERAGYGTCTKDDSVAPPYVLGPAPEGSVWTLLVVKAGETDDLHFDPSPTTEYHHSEKDSISHVITCWAPQLPVAGPPPEQPEQPEQPETPQTPEQPARSLAVDLLTTSCVKDIPYVVFDIRPVGFTPTNGATLSFFRPSDPSHPVQVVKVPSLSGSVVYPGASASPADWPGWALVDGTWVVDPTDADLRLGLDVVIQVNPTATGSISYPKATETCAGPSLPPPAPQPEPQPEPLPQPEPQPEPEPQPAPEPQSAPEPQVPLPAAGVAALDASSPRSLAQVSVVAPSVPAVAVPAELPKTGSGPQALLLAALACLLAGATAVVAARSLRTSD
jgi:LPXTG-motif cell wall-anchored protein